MHQSNARSSSPHSSAVREREADPVARAVAGLRQRAGDAEQRGDAGGVVERGAEPAVVVGADDDRAGRVARQVADDVAAGGPGRDRRVHGHRRLDRAVREPRAERVAVAHPDRHHRRRPGVPVAVEAAERALGLEVGPALRGRHQHPGGAAQPELQPGVRRRAGALAPVDQHERAADVEPVQVAPPPAAGVDDPGADAAGRGRRGAAERGALDRAAVAGLEPRALEAPAVDRHLLDRDALEPDLAQLVRDVRGGLAVLGRPGHAEAERARADRGQALDHAAQVAGVDREAAGDRERLGAGRRREHRAGVGGRARPGDQPVEHRARPARLGVVGDRVGPDAEAGLVADRRERVRLPADEPDRVAGAEPVRPAGHDHVHAALDDHAGLLAGVRHRVADRPGARLEPQREEVDPALRAAGHHLVAEALELDDGAVAGAGHVDRRRLLAGEEVEQRGVERAAEAPQRAERRLARSALDLAQRGGGHADLVRELRERQRLCLPQAAQMHPELLPDLAVEAGHGRLTAAGIQVTLQHRK